MHKSKWSALLVCQGHLLTTTTKKRQILGIIDQLEAQQTQWQAEGKGFSWLVVVSNSGATTESLMYISRKGQMQELRPEK